MEEVPLTNYSHLYKRVGPYVRPYARMSVRPSIGPSISPSVHPSVGPSIGLSVGHAFVKKLKMGKVGWNMNMKSIWKDNLDISTPSGAN